ncbi:T9SS type A sorting domain-containing protein [candidate division KSB1 bacterium]|nr:T9SS type A sorting domain-containing protein [candidate division KSB1 bacterium]
MANIIILLILLGSTGFAAPRAELLWGIPGASPVSPTRCRPRTLDDDSLHNYDALSLTADLRFSVVAHSVSGVATIRLTGAADLPRVNLRLSSTYDIDSVTVVGLQHVASYAQQGTDSLQIDLTPPLAAGDTIGIAIAYHGTPPQIDTWGGFRFAPESGWRPEIGFSMGDGLSLDPPPSNYNWLPSYADPADKLSWECFLTPDFGTVATTNGSLVDTLRMPDNLLRWHYVQPEPISTYLIFVAISDYELMVQRQSDPQILNYVYPSRVTQAQTHFSNVPAVLDGYSALFGPYPFARFGYNMTRIGDMEHATCVSHLDQAVVANHAYDWLLFHEMSHMWWGDWVTLGDWRDLWLNEGFATYCEALGMEIMGGHTAYQDYIVGGIYPDARSATDSYSIYDPDYYWGATVYQKGAAVMHMLRELLGDSAFFGALREFGQEHAYGNAVTADWQAKLEQHYGESLDWFFDEWVYGTRYPRYRLTYGLFDTGFELEQIQTSPTYFRMPLEIRWYDGDRTDSVTRVYWTEPVADQFIEIGEPLPDFFPWDAAVDPNHKILKTAQVIIEGDDAEEQPALLPLQFAITSVTPNPFNAAATLRFVLPTPTRVDLHVYNIQGALVEPHDAGTLSAGPQHMTWSGAGHASGLYIFQLSTPAQSLTAKAVLLK